MEKSTSLTYNPHPTFPKPTHQISATTSSTATPSDNHHKDEDMSADSDMEELEVDAEGTEEDDESPADDGDALSPVDVPTPLTDSSASSKSSLTNKQKRNNESENLNIIQQNPELYGLRRSGRAHAVRQIVDSSDEDIAPRRSAPKRRAVRQVTASNSPMSNNHNNNNHNEDDEDDEDDEDEFITNRRSKNRRIKSKSKPSTEPSAAYQRFSTRRVNNVTYKLDDDSDAIDEDDVQEWHYVQEDELTGKNVKPNIDLVLNFRAKPGLSLQDPDLEKEDCEYWVKWQDKAYYAATWGTYEELVAAAPTAIRKLKNFWDRIALNYLLTIQSDVGSDDREIDMMKWAQKLEEFETYQNVEKVIAYEPDDEQYLVKWQALGYDGCTWEDSDFISSKAPDALDDFLLRSQRQPKSDKSQKWDRRHKTRFVAFKKQPSYIKGGELRSFQLLGLNFLAMKWCDRLNVIIADEMGLGKTVQTVSYINWMINEKKQEGPHLVVVPLSTLHAWMETFAKWAPELNVISYHGNRKARDIIHEHELFLNRDPRRVKFNVLVTTYELCIDKDCLLNSVNWESMAVDEAHRLKNPESQLYKSLASFNCPAKLLITGTPMQNNVAELFALVDFLNPGMIADPGDVENLDPEVSGPLVLEFKNQIRPLMIRRTKSEVEKDLPPKTECILRVACSKLQTEIYQNIYHKNYAALREGSNGQKQSLLNVMMELKKCANHPFLFNGVEDRVLGSGANKEDTIRALVTTSGKMTLLDNLLTRLKAEGHRVLIFTQLVMMLNILNDYLQMKGYRFQRLDGTVSSSARRQAIDRFNAPESEDFAFILSTRAGGLGINLATADRIILFDSDWNPHLDIQAMARAHRIGQTKPVQVFRFVSNDTIEEEVLQRARNKLMLEHLLIQTGADQDEAKVQRKLLQQAIDGPQNADEIVEMLKRRAVKMFEKTETDEDELGKFDLDKVLGSAEVHQTQDASAIKSSDGGIDFMKAMIQSVKFEGGWDEIIPKDKLAELEAEETKKDNEEFLQKVQEENKPRKRKAVLTARDAREARKKAKLDEFAEIGEESAEEDNGDQSDTNLDPHRPFVTSDWRALIRLVEQWGGYHDGDASQRIFEAREFRGRESSILAAASQELFDGCRSKVEEEKLKVDELAKPGKTLTKKDKKAVLMEFHGVKRVNCETILERHERLVIARSAVENLDPEYIGSFRVPEATKAASYSCEWGPKDDGMLVIGLARHGFGAWVAIRDDGDLGFQDKFFLEENRAENKSSRAENENGKSPGAVHLVRRANYLLQILETKVNDKSEKSDKSKSRSKKNQSRIQTLKQSGSPLSVNGSSSPRPSSAHGDTPGYKRKVEVNDEPRSSKKNKAVNEDYSSVKVKSEHQKSSNGISRGSRDRSRSPKKEKHRDRDSFDSPRRHKDENRRRERSRSPHGRPGYRQNDSYRDEKRNGHYIKDDKRSGQNGDRAHDDRHRSNSVKDERDGHGNSVEIPKKKFTGFGEAFSKKYAANLTSSDPNATHNYYLCNEHFKKHAPGLLDRIKEGMNKSKDGDSSTDKKERAAAFKKGLADAYTFINTTGAEKDNGDPETFTKTHLWYHLKEFVFGKNASVQIDSLESLAFKSREAFDKAEKQTQEQTSHPK